MPRTGGVYSPPAGTKGTPNTTIQSVPYNTFIDDLTADANAARPVTAGGTGATSASAARAALGLEIGTNVQAYDAGLTSIAGLTTAANQMLYTTGVDLYATTALTAFARTILDDADASTVLSTLGVSAFAKTILDDADAAAVRTTIGAQASLGFTPVNKAGDTMTGALEATTLKANAGAVYNEGSGDRFYWMRTAAGVPRGAVVHDNAASAVAINLYDTGGVFVRNLTLRQDAGIFWSGNVVWHAGNDGSGSGLDAGLLEGQAASFYTNIPARLGFTPVQQGGGTGQNTNKVFIGDSATGLRATVVSTDYGKIWTDSIVTGTVSSWVKFPNGLILQTGTSVAATNGSADGTIAYPTSFPTACASITACVGDAALTATDLKVHTPLSVAGFSFRSPGAASTNVRVNWIAWGY